MSKHHPRGRRVPPTPEQLARWEVTEGRGVDEAAWNEAEDNRTLGQRQIAVGTIKNPDSGLYQTWVSLYGTDVTCWTASPDPDRAKRDAAQISAFFHGQSPEYDDILAFCDQIVKSSAAEPLPLPDDLVRVICMQIARAQQRAN